MLPFTCRCACKLPFFFFLKKMGNFWWGLEAFCLAHFVPFGASPSPSPSPSEREGRRWREREANGEGWARERVGGREKGRERGEGERGVKEGRERERGRETAWGREREKDINILDLPLPDAHTHTSTCTAAFTQLSTGHVHCCAVHEASHHFVYCVSPGLAGSSFHQVFSCHYHLKGWYLCIDNAGVTINK